MKVISNILPDSSGQHISIVGVSNAAKRLIEKFEEKLKGRILIENDFPSYSSIDDILIKKYHKKDIDKLELPDFRDKTEFIAKGVRGNLQKCDGNVLSYADGEKIINEGIEEEIP